MKFIAEQRNYCSAKRQVELLAHRMDLLLALTLCFKAGRITTLLGCLWEDRDPEELFYPHEFS